MAITNRNYPPIPTSLQEIKDIFGDIDKYIKDDGTISCIWEARLDYVNLPKPIKVSWSEYKINRFRCHKLLVPVFNDLITEIGKRGLYPHVKEFGGCYSFRPKRVGTNHSTHSWGIAIDLNPATNQMGLPGDMNKDLIKCFEDFGFTWGGHFPVKDSMHFQYCHGY